MTHDPSHRTPDGGARHEVGGGGSKATDTGRVWVTRRVDRAAGLKQ